ncbi:MAG: bifunctional UDP-N-acetylglucosamine diphosphorylase/glucosamine-1-phosphate N-acetyltransferase GlmU [Anaerolineae bacterium]|nr:bifunctional UDP-N-acetylglucosamine diphosphorylase/glucosamine-1-phosphate N-acetyltransferase GlmU [Anaerolineae bacterium]
MSLDFVILAAGQGTRMKSRLPKVLHPLAGKPLVLYGVQEATSVCRRPPVLVIGHGGDAVREAVGEAARFVEQSEQLGTGHAVLQVRSLLAGQSQYIIVFYADMPLLQASTLCKLYEVQQDNDGPLSLLTVVTDNTRGFGRIVRDGQGSFCAIVEEAQATPEQLAIHEVNLGVYCFDADWLWSHLDQLPLTSKGEYYLTDLASIAVSEGSPIKAISVDDPDEALGINTRVHLAEAEAVLRRRTNEKLMLSGVTIIDPATTYIHSTVQIGQDTTIFPNTHLRGATVIGQECNIGPNTIIEDTTIGNNCVITASVLESAVVEDHVDIGPFGHLRKGAYLESHVHMGNFGEIKNSRLRRGVKMGHFSYLGDADVGEEANIGAGSITCNYDGRHKHKTTIGKHVFVGSDTMLVAPVTLGDAARTGAGSVVTRDVPPGTLVYGVPAHSSGSESDKDQEG